MVCLAYFSTVYANVSGGVLKVLKFWIGFKVCVHGTYTKLMDQIWEQGLKRMKRNHIHFATGLPEDDGVISGMFQLYSC
jgi:hypothetical protein